LVVKTVRVRRRDGEREGARGRERGARGRERGRERGARERERVMEREGWGMMERERGA